MQRFLLLDYAGMEGFEPPVLRLTAGRFTLKLHSQYIINYVWYSWQDSNP